MKKRRITPCLLAALLASTTPAYADDANAYISSLASQGVTGDRDMFVGIADDLCAAAAQVNRGGVWLGMSPNVAAAMRTQATLNSHGFTDPQVTIVLKTARNVYCPQNGTV